MDMLGHAACTTTGMFTLVQEGDEAIVQTVPRILAQSKKAANGASVKNHFQK